MKSPPAVRREPMRLLSVVIPARNEEDSVAAAVEHLHQELERHEVPHEIVVVDDGSSDATWSALDHLRTRIPQLRPVSNPGRHGFGRAVTYGFSQARGDAVVVMMADESDESSDVVRYWRLLEEGWDAVFGSRFMRGGKVIDYPWHKLLLNRLANQFLRVLFQVRFNDFTNAFKAYRITTLEGCRPFLSPHFNLTVELPLKTMVRGYSWTVIPTTWRNRTSGISKLRIREMGSRYLFIAIYCWLEKHFSQGDYKRE
jgi:dolichol-phosphate mannosyltransferase